jgi:hypothetical protein
MIKWLIKKLFKDELDKAYKEARSHHNYQSRTAPMPMTVLALEPKGEPELLVIEEELTVEPCHIRPSGSVRKNGYTKIKHCAECDFAGHFFNIDGHRTCPTCGDRPVDRTAKWCNTRRRWILKGRK